MFSTFDIIVFIIIMISSTLGMYYGFIRLSINLITFCASIVAAYYIYPFITIGFAGYIHSVLISLILSTTTAYIISLIMLNLLKVKLLTLISDITGGIVDRLIGLGMGCIRGIAICVLLFLTVVIFVCGTYLQANDVADLLPEDNSKYPQWLKQSVTTTYLDKISRIALTLIPSQFFTTWLSNQRATTTTHIITKPIDSNIRSNTPQGFQGNLDNALEELLAPKSPKDK